MRLWDVRTGKALAVLEDHTGNITTVAFSADGKSLATGGGDGTIRLWRVR
jgi:WD40 repeat protein